MHIVYIGHVPHAFLSNIRVTTKQEHCSASVFYDFATLASNIRGLNDSRMVFQNAKPTKVSSRKNSSAYGIHHVRQEAIQFTICHKMAV